MAYNLELGRGDSFAPNPLVWSIDWGETKLDGQVGKWTEGGGRYWYRESAVFAQDPAHGDISGKLKARVEDVRFRDHATVLALIRRTRIGAMCMFSA